MGVFRQFNKNLQEPDEKNGIIFMSALMGWANQNGMKVSVAKKNDFANAYVMPVFDSISIPMLSPMAIVHEWAHAYLHRCGYHTPQLQYFPEGRPAKVQKDAGKEDPTASPGMKGIRKAFDEIIEKVDNYIDVSTSPTNAYREHHRRLNGLVFDISCFELELLQNPQKPQAKKSLGLLIKVFGEPEYLPARFNNDFFMPTSPDTDIESHFNAGLSYVGHLVDESFHLGIDPHLGHPMTQFHEFYASAVNTWFFDGDSFFSTLSSFKKASQEDPNLKRVYEKSIILLAETLALAWQFHDELKNLAIPLPGLDKFGKNLKKLEKTLSES